MKNKSKFLLTYAILIAIGTLLTISCSDDNEPIAPKIIEATCEDGIKNQDEEGIDCGGICKACPPEQFLIEEGNYRGYWNSKATNGSVYTNLKITAKIKKSSDNVYTGSLYISDNYVSCCNSGANGDGPIKINITNGKVTFNWIDQIPSCKGNFNASGTITKNNHLKLNLNGKDCEGDHIGSIEFFK